MVALLPRPLYVRGVRAPHELDAFAVGYERVSGYRVPRDYLALADVFVAKRHGRVVGGFALNVDPPFRTEARLPDTEKSRLASAFAAANTVELTCVWLDKDVRGVVTSAVLWANLVWRAARRRTHVVFGTEVDQLRRLYEMTHPHLLYDGQVCVDGRERRGWVYSIEVTRFPLITTLRVVTWRRAR